jgi:hypothetical protein
MYYFSIEATYIQKFNILSQTSHLLILKFARVFSDFPTSCIVMCAIRMLQVWYHGCPVSCSAPFDGIILRKLQMGM